MLVPVVLNQAAMVATAQDSAQPKQHRKPSEDLGDKLPQKPFNQLIQNTDRIDGLFPMYRSTRGTKLYAEISPEQLNRNYFAAITLASGIGESGIYSGLPIGEFMFTLRKVNNAIQFVIPNTYFRAERGTPMARSINRSFSDSVLEVMPIRGTHPDRKTLLVELNSLLLGDLAGFMPVVSAALGGGYVPDPGMTAFGSIKGFPQNIEVESVYGFAGGGRESEMPAYVSALPDSRAFSLRVHYSLSVLPENTGYRPRVADNRVGYFITAFRDFNDDTPRQSFVRYINRWHLEKADPNAALSSPKKPIVFWIENTVPNEYRDAVRDGVLMWNKAFEKIGFRDAIEVKQMPNNADWDPADVRYNTIRWFNSTDSVFALGPSRTNPLTGEILDADILVAADFTRFTKESYRSIVEQNQIRTAPFAAKVLGKNTICNYGLASRYLERQATEQKPMPRLRFSPNPISYQDLCLGTDAAKQFSLGSMALPLLQNALPNGPEIKAFTQDFMRELIAHEVGHTLGLRHNFHASAMLRPEDLNNTTLTRQRGMTASVMDYTPMNLAPQGVQQGDYYTRLVGPYDEWAIEYGYSVNDARTIEADGRIVDAIAKRAPQPELAYATDEDIFAFLDPEVNVFDLSGNLLTYAQWQMDNARQMWKKMNTRYPREGDGFNEVRVAFNAVFDYYFQYSSFLSQYIGGQFFNRFKAGDAKGRLPFEPVPLEQQRQALALIQRNIFSEEPFKFDPDLLNKLAPSRWYHWGAEPTANLEYPIHDVILFLQSAVLYDLLSGERMERLRDAELRTRAGQAMTIPELMDGVQMAIWREVYQPTDGFKLSGLRRALQREYMNALVNMVLRRTRSPEDAITVARYKLKQLNRAIAGAINKADGKDVYTRAHLEDARDRIAKALDAPLQGR